MRHLKKYEMYSIEGTKVGKLEDLDDLIANIKDEFKLYRVNFDVVKYTNPGFGGFYGFECEVNNNHKSYLEVIFDFDPQYYLENKEKLEDAMNEFENRLADFKFRINKKTIAKVKSIYKAHEDERRQHMIPKIFSYFYYKVELSLIGNDGRLLPSSF